MLTTTEQNELECRIDELKEALELQAKSYSRLYWAVRNLQNLFTTNEMFVRPKETILRDVRIAVESEIDKQIEVLHDD